MSGLLFLKAVDVFGVEKLLRYRLLARNRESDRIVLAACEEEMEARRFH